MTRLVPVAAIAVATLGGCSTPPQTGGPAQPNPTVVTHVHPYKTGNGVVQSVLPVPVAAGADSSAMGLQRLEIKMDNGTVQYVDTPSREFTRGTRVTLTEDHLIKRM